jgi:D-amino-acid dehydrogenase
MAGIVVIGGGVVGLCVAEALHRRGADVTLLERGRCGAGASRGNAGWITPSHSVPLPAPGVILQALRWLPDPGGPLRLRPTAAMVPWGVGFWRHSRAGAFSAGAAALQRFAATATADLHALRARTEPFELHDAPLLYPAASEQELAALVHELEVLRQAGYGAAAEILDPGAALRHEPALAATTAGALLLHGEAQVRPESLCGALHATLVAAGVDVREHEEVRGLERVGASWRVTCASGTRTADAVVVAAGADAPAVLRQAGLRLPLQPAKGYSITIPSGPDAPRGPVYLHTAKIAISPYDGSVRVSGMLELGARTLHASSRRIERMLRRAAEALPGWRPRSGGEPWAGARPLLADGLPAIGPVSARPGLFLAVGHGTLGMTLGPTTGRVLADAIVDGAPVADALSTQRLRLG